MLEDRIIKTVMYVSETISNSRPKIWDILPTELNKSCVSYKIDEWTPKNCLLCKT